MKVIEDKMYKHLDDLRMVYKSSLKTGLLIGGSIRVLSIQKPLIDLLNPTWTNQN